jgi:hypothetical protein
VSFHYHKRHFHSVVQLLQDVRDQEAAHIVQTVFPSCEGAAPCLKGCPNV